MEKQNQTKTTTKPVSKTQQNQQLDIPTYPNANLLPAEASPKGIQIIEMTTQDNWQHVLTFYKEKFIEKGWSIFASEHLKDLGTISFHPTTKETVTVLAACENSLTHIRIYIQK
jgi:hypothetical protein